MKSTPLNTLRITLGLGAFLAAGAFLTLSAGATDPLPRLLPEALEAELALSAMPERLRAEAGVHVLRRGGYSAVKPATNHFSCFVVRTVPRVDIQSVDTLIPICFDDEGMRTIAPVHFDAAKLREQGALPAEIRAHLQAGFASGIYRAPGRTGMSYMISPVLNLPDGEGGVWNYPPHFMFYAPGLTNTDQDALPDREGGWLPWINNEGPHGMIIVPLGQAEREQVRQSHGELIRKVERFLSKS